MTQGIEIRLKSRPKGMPTADNFEAVKVDVKDPGEGQVLLQNLWMSVDPYMRGRMRLANDGDPLFGGTIGRVIASNNADYAEGDILSHGLGWREYALSGPEGLMKVDPDLAPLSTYLGVMGMPGMTAYGGILEIGKMQDGEAVFVSAASGAVGSVVGQIAKIKNGTVIGSAGSDAKVAQLTEAFGFDHGFNYKTANALDELKKGAPKGIDIYFENVGGEQLEAALTHMRPHGRVPICGMIAHYNDDGTASPGPRNLTETIYKFVTLRGFVVSEFEHLREQFLQDMSGWVKSGQVKYFETVHEGIEAAPEAFMGLFTGSNNGKMLVKLAD